MPENTEPKADATTNSPPIPALRRLYIREDGAITFDAAPIGRVVEDGGEGSQARLVLNLGWMKLAGVSITLQDDPEVEHHRGGIAFER